MLLFLIAAAASAVLCLKLLTAPIRFFWKLILNWFFGWLFLLLLNLLGCAFGFHIGISAFTALIVGFLGIPGTLLLFALQWLL